MSNRLSPAELAGLPTKKRRNFSTLYALGFGWHLWDVLAGTATLVDALLCLAFFLMWIDAIHKLVKREIAEKFDAARATPKTETAPNV